jgi:hypothetical protein
MVSITDIAWNSGNQHSTARMCRVLPIFGGRDPPHIKDLSEHYGACGRYLTAKLWGTPAPDLPSGGKTENKYCLETV